MKKCKVIQVLPDIGAGGAERLVLDIAKHLDKKRYEVKSVSLYSKEHCAGIYRDFGEKNGIEILYLDKKPGLDFSVVRKLKKLYAREKPDVVHSHLYAAIYSVWPAVRCGVGVRLHTVHNVAAKELPGSHQKLMRLAYRRGWSTPVAISDIIRDSVCAAYGLAPQAVPRINNGVDTRRFAGAPIPHEGVQLINVARFTEQKNHRLLLDAFAQAKKQVENIRLCLVGDGELRPQIEARIDELELARDVVLAGVSGDVERFLHESDAFVMSSDYEGLPLSVMEAMSAGLPVVSTRAGGVPNILEEGANAFMVGVGDCDALADRICRIARSPETRRAFGARSRELSAAFDVREMVRRYEVLYQGGKLPG